MSERTKANGRRRALAMLLVIVMAVGMALPAAAAGGSQENVNQAEGHEAAPPRLNGTAVEKNAPDENEIVRVSIALEEPSTLAAGFSTRGIANNAAAMSYRAGLDKRQADVQRVIERTALGGKKLDVVWNLTLAANIISANVRRGDIDAIKSVPGVRTVEEETQYTPDVVSVGGELRPNMAIAGEMNGSSQTWNIGYKGEGTVIAIVDTGLDTNHQSFDNDAFLEALGGDVSKLKLTEDDIENNLTRLNAYQSRRGITVDDVYHGEKVAYAFNYKDHDLDITHDNDSQGEHGSHVAGIAAANELIPVTNEDGSTDYVNALDTVKVAGNAPNAQLIIMKVFGKAGGPYDAECVAAIEDAILLGADVVNLSLGSSNAGNATPSREYAAIQELLVNSDTVVAMSAGNSGAWAENTPYGNLYIDGVNFHTGGAAGSYTNSFTVASVDNDGFIGPSVVVGETLFGFVDGADGSTGVAAQPGLATLDKSGTGEGTKYQFVMLASDAVNNPEGLDLEEDFFKQEEIRKLFEEDENTIAITWRGGGTEFYKKANYGAAAGAAAVLVADNQTGIIGTMDLTEYGYKAPVAMVNRACGSALWDSVPEDEIKTITLHTGNGMIEAGCRYIVGELTVCNSQNANSYGSENYTMSYFSSWGTTGDLALKPEITAPGGSIYSVNGADRSGTAYELMSGTSMASPQISGMSALVQQYLREASEKGEITLPNHSDMNRRALTQSLLMSTAHPMKNADNEDNYYSLLQQGAGLANVADAVSTPVYITVEGTPDGKVKAELGDDYSRKGEYTVVFTLHNLTDKEQSYDLSADVFTQDYFDMAVAEDRTETFLSTGTRPMGADVVFDEASVTVPGNGEVKVTATITLNEDERQTLEDHYPTGAYVEALIHAAPEADSEGATAPALSVPVLGYYGSWTEPSMYDLGDPMEWYEPNFERTPYLYNELFGVVTNVVYVDNAYAFDGDGFDSDSQNVEYLYSLVRNAGNGVMRIRYTDENGQEQVYWSEDQLDMDPESLYAATYVPANAAWIYSQSLLTPEWRHGELPDGSEVEVTLIMAPEYYADENGEYDWEKLTDGNPDNGELGPGAFLTTTLVVDRQPPELVGDPEVRQVGSGYEISVTVKDNISVKGVSLISESSNQMVYQLSELDYTPDGFHLYTPSDPGEEKTVTFDGVYTPNGYYLDIFGLYYWTRVGDLYEDVYQIHIWDGGGNEIVKRLYVGMDETEDVEEVRISESSTEVAVALSHQLTAAAYPVTLIERGVTWESDNTSVATVDSTGLVTGVAPGDAVITATSKSDPGVSASCLVHVYPINVVLNGVLGYGEDGVDRSAFYTWDIGTGEMEQGGEVSVYPDAVADIPGTDNFYLFDINRINDSEMDSRMYVMSKSTGEPVAEPYSWDPNDGIPWAMTVTEDGIHWCYGYFIMLGDRPDERTYTLFNFFDWKPWFTALAANTTPWEESAQDGDGNVAVYSGSCILYAIDDTGRVWTLPLYKENGAFKMLLAYSDSDLPLMNGFGDTPYCNAVIGSDGALYYSMHNNSTAELYRMVYSEEEDFWHATYLGDFGDGVYPGFILDSDRLRYDFNRDGTVDADDAQALMDHVICGTPLKDCAVDGDVDGDGAVDTHDVHVLLDMIKNGTTDEAAAPIPADLQAFDGGPEVEPGDIYAAGRERPDGSVPETEPTAPAAAGEPETQTSDTRADIAVDKTAKTVTVKVNVSGSTNGDFTLEYDPDVLTLETLETSESAVTSHLDGRDSVRVGYASDEELSGTVITAVFSYSDGTTTDLTLTVTEDGENSMSLTTTDTADLSSGGSTGGGSTGGGIGGGGSTGGSTGGNIGGGTGTGPAPQMPDIPVLPGDDGGYVEHYSDVTPGAWYESYVERVNRAGVMRGYGDGVFGVGNQITRAEMATILYKMAGSPKDTYYADFDDVSADAYYADAVAWTDAMGIMTGDGVSFSPNAPITRQEMVTALWRFAKRYSYDIRLNDFTMPEFKDEQSIAAWAKDAMSWAVKNGLIQGKGNGIVDPQGTALREEAAKVFACFLDLSPVK